MRGETSATAGYEAWSDLRTTLANEPARERHGPSYGDQPVARHTVASHGCSERGRPGGR